MWASIWAHSERRENYQEHICEDFSRLENFTKGPRPLKTWKITGLV